MIYYFSTVLSGLVPRKARELSEKFDIPIPKSKLLTPEKQQNVRSLLRDYYNSLCKHLLKDHREMQAFEKQNRKILQTRGELTLKRKERMEDLQVSYTRLLTSVQNFSEVLDEPSPELPEDMEAKSDIEDKSLKMVSEGEDSTHVENMWGDEETRRFEHIIKLLLFNEIIIIIVFQILSSFAGFGCFSSRQFYERSGKSRGATG